MNKLRLLGCMCAVAAFGVQATTAVADPNPQTPAICANQSAEVPLSGTYGNLTLTGESYVPAGQTLAVTGNLKLAPGACLDAFTLGTVTVAHNVIVGNGAILALGCTPGSLGPPFDQPPCDGMTTNDTVGGNVTANNPWTMYLDGDTIWGNLTSTGGGPGPTFNPYVNFPIKDNTIYGNVTVTGWEGAWFGLLRNTTYKNVTLNHNVGVTIGDLGTPDSTEVTSNTIAGNLICQGNVPAAQIGDSMGGPNTVGKKEIGQCAGL